MLAISHEERVEPGRSAARRKVFSCMCGEQAATTTPSSLCSAIGLLDQRLARVGAHVLVVDGVDDAGELAQRPRATARAVDGAGDVLAAVADEDADAGHQRPLLSRRVGAARPSRAAAAFGLARLPRHRAAASPAAGCGRCRRSGGRGRARRRQAEGEADELGEEEDRHRRPRRAPSSPSAGSRGWSGTSGRRRRSPRRRRRASSRIARPSRTTEAVRRQREAAAAAVERHVPVDRLGAAGARRPPPSRSGASGSSKADDLGRAHQQAAVVAGHLEPVERVGVELRGALLDRGAQRRAAARRRSATATVFANGRARTSVEPARPASGSPARVAGRSRAGCSRRRRARAPRRSPCASASARLRAGSATESRWSVACAEVAPQHDQSSTSTSSTSSAASTARRLSSNSREVACSEQPG